MVIEAIAASPILPYATEKSVVPTPQKNSLIITGNAVFPNCDINSFENGFNFAMDHMIGDFFIDISIIVNKNSNILAAIVATAAPTTPSTGMPNLPNIKI